MTRLVTGQENDEVTLSGVVILEERHAAFTLNKLIEVDSLLGSGWVW